MENDAEIIRIRYKYRKLIMEGKIELPYDEAVRLIGPDSAYHLYFSLKNRSSDEVDMKGGRERIEGD
jgi:hypothetical protein